MKKLLLFLLLMSQVFALSLTKEVVGNQLIDVNQTLDVSVKIASDTPVYLEKLEDAIPVHFSAYGYPSSCKQTEDTLVCIFGQEFKGELTISYKLLALGTGSGLITSPKLFYEGGIKTLDFFQQYFIGKPRINLELVGDETLLPSEEINVSIILRNPGTRSVNDATLKFSYDNTSSSESFSLNPGEILNKKLSLGYAKDKGMMNLKVDVIWTNQTISKEKLFVFISPSVSVTRDVKVKWQVNNDKELKKYVEVKYKMHNNGTAVGNVSFNSGDKIAVNSGETKTIKKLYLDKAPVEKIAVKDSRGEVYNTYFFEEVNPEAKKGFFVLLYEYVGSDLSPLVVLGILIGGLYFSTKFKNSNLKAAFLLISLISALLIYSYFSVGALNIFGFGPKSLVDSISLQFPKNVSGDLFS